MSYDVTESLQIALREFLGETCPDGSRARCLAEELETELDAKEVANHG